MISAKEARSKMFSIEDHLKHIQSAINVAASSNRGYVSYNFSDASDEVRRGTEEQLILLGYIIKRDYKGSKTVEISY